MSKKTDVAVAEKPDNLPAYLQNKQYAPQQDNFDSSDVVVPRVKLLQATSSELTDFDDAKAGNFWHTGADLNLGDSTKFVVISRKKKYLLVAPLDDGQGVLARAEDATTWDRTGKWEIKLDKRNTAIWEITDLDVAKSGLTDWGTSDPHDENSPPAATLFYEYMVLLPDHLELGPAILSLARTAIKSAKKGLNDKIAMHRSAGRPMQAIQFMMKSTVDQNDSGQDYRGYQFVGAGFATEEVFNTAMEYAETLTDYKVMDEASAADEGTRKKADSEDF